MSNGFCRALVIRCIDFRIRLKPFSDLLETIGYQEGSYDLMSLPGSAKGLLSVDESLVLTRCIQIAERLHNIAEIIIIYHNNCGAYGIDDPKKEFETQKNDLQAITLSLKIAFPRIKVRTFIMNMKPSKPFTIAEII